jgi:hypothetical protein
MFNDKQIELSRELFSRLKRRFPEIELAGITESAENPAHVWVNLVMPQDVDREIELREQASELSTDILEDYGYLITVISADQPERSAA